MTLKRRAFVKVPASSGNVGPGFDVLGLSLSLYSELTVRVVGRQGAPQIRVIGEGASTVSKTQTNIIYQCVRKVLQKAGKAVPALELICVNRIPLARGLGSSSSAILAGLLAGNRLLNDKFSKTQILTWATELEGHPDNVAASLLGGVRASAFIDGKVETFALPNPRCRFVVAIPEFELSTKKARAVLPKAVPMKDAVANLAAVAALPAAFQKNLGQLKDLLNDRLHEPYRAKLIPGFYSVKKAALKAGAYGMTLSGAGPTLLSFVDSKKAARVANAMAAAFKKAGVKCRTLNLSIDQKGAVVR